MDLESHTSKRIPRVCFFPGQLQLGGIGRITLNLVEEMLNRGIRVDLFLSKKSGVYVAQIPEGARVFDAGTTVRWAVLPLARYLRRERPDLLISARSYINLAAIIAKGIAGVDTTVVVSEHTNHGTIKRLGGAMGFRQSAIRRGVRLLYPRAEHVVAVSRAAADDAAEDLGIDRTRIKVIYNPVITHRVNTLYHEPLEDPWVDASTDPLVLGVGRLTLQKDFFTLIRAFAEVRRTMRARLLILGEGEDREALEALADELGVRSDIYLPGYVDNPFAYMRRADVFVLSSRWEALPTALIEAMGSGTPVISTDCPGGSREILAGGKFGKLVPVEDAGALADAILDTLAHPGEPQLVRDRAGHFSPERAADEYLALLPPTARWHLTHVG